MPGSPATKRRLGVLALVAVVVTATAILLGRGLLVTAPSGGTAAPTRPAAEPTPLADVDTSRLTLDRVAFCDRVSAEAIARVLGQSAGEATSWQPGERLPASQQISNEFGCAWSAGPVSARAWVFAPPITPDRARDFTDEAVGKGCTKVSGAPSLGSPTLTQRCTAKTGAGATSVYGLLGDTWVGCEIIGIDQADGANRVGEWCVEVLEALRAT